MHIFSSSDYQSDQGNYRATDNVRKTIYELKMVKNTLDI